MMRSEDYLPSLLSLWIAGLLVCCFWYLVGDGASIQSGGGASSSMFEFHSFLHKFIHCDFLSFLQVSVDFNFLSSYSSFSIFSLSVLFSAI